MEITTPQDLTYQNRFLSFYLTTSIVDPSSNETEVDVFEGISFFKYGNIYLVGRNRGGKQPISVFLNWSDVDPRIGMHIKTSTGNIIAGIGNHDHVSRKISTQFTSDFSKITMGEYSIDDNILDFYANDALKVFEDRI